jgi:hypothetical protein
MNDRLRHFYVAGALALTETALVRLSDFIIPMPDFQRLLD